MAHLVAQKERHVCGAYLVVHFVRWLGLGTGFLSKRSRRARHLGESGMGSLHECGWLLLMLISNAYLYKFPRRAVSRSTRLGIEKEGFGGEQGGGRRGATHLDI